MKKDNYIKYIYKYGDRKIVFNLSVNSNWLDMLQEFYNFIRAIMGYEISVDEFVLDDHVCEENINED